MPFEISRRRWFASAVTATTCLSLSYAEPPSPSPSVETNPRIATNALPIPSRVVRLRAIGKNDTARVVITGIATDPRGELIAVSGDDHVVRIMNADTMNVVQTLEEHRDLIRTLAFDSRGKRLVSAGNDGQLIVWDREDSFSIAQRTQDAPALTCANFSASGSELAAVGFDNTVFLFDKRSSLKPVFQCDCKDLRAVAYRDDDKVLAVAGRSGDLHLIEPSSGRKLSDHELHHGRIHGLAFHRESNLVVCIGDDGHVTVFDTEMKKLRQRFRATSGKLYAVAVVDSQRVAVAGSDNAIRVVNSDNGQIELTLDAHKGTVATLAANGGTLFSGGFDATLRRWSISGSSGAQQRIAEGDSNVDR